MRVRVGREGDREQIARIQAASPEAAQWAVEDNPLLIAELDGCVVGFLVWRENAPEEAEILNLAVDPAYRRRGAAGRLIAEMPHPEIFLEVRESNQGARALYRQAGFREVGRRPAYYQDPAETAIVMRWQK